MLAQQAQFLGLGNGGFQTVDGQGILCPDVNIPLLGPDGQRGNHHALDHPVGITLHDASIHECAGIALVAVADHIAGGLLLTGHLAPFPPGGEACTAPAAESGLGDGVDDGFRGHFKHGGFKGGIGPDRQGVFNMLGVDMTAVFQHQPGLLGVEGDLLLGLIDLAAGMEHQPLHGLAPEHGFFKDFLAVLGLDL